MKIKCLLGVFLAVVLILNGCVQQPPRYVCTDGTIVSDSSACPKLEPEFTCQDGTKVTGYGECCSTNLITGSPNEGLLKYCKDVIGTYFERIYCDGDFHIGERYSCQSNRCIKRADRIKCVEGSTCVPYGNTVTCGHK